jgi:hypothetical protein
MGALVVSLGRVSSCVCRSITAGPSRGAYSRQAGTQMTKQLPLHLPCKDIPAVRLWGTCMSKQTHNSMLGT